jgi:hypothetical protein
MAKDHFVAQTYLKHWCSPRTTKLRGYKKAADESFSCSQKDVCHEWNWDINPLFADNPALLADFNHGRFGIAADHVQIDMAGNRLSVSTLVVRQKPKR